MGEPNSREFYDLVTEIKVELGVINTKVDYLNDVKRIAEEANFKAEKALLQSEDNEKDIDRMQTTTKWAIGLTVTSILSIGGLVIAIVF